MTINFIIESILFGFAFYSIVQILLQKYFIKNKLVVLDEVDLAATILIRFVGILYVLFLTITTSYDPSIVGNSYEKYAMLNRMFGPYWFSYWTYILSYYVLPQLLWIERFRNSKGFRIILAGIILFVLSIESLIVLLASFHRDYISSGWVMYSYGISNNVFLNRIIDLGVFTAALWVTYSVVKMIKKKNKV